MVYASSVTVRRRLGGAAASNSSRAKQFMPIYGEKPKRARMVNMNDSMAQRDPALMPLELHSWKTAVNWLAAISVSLIFLVAGIWKVTDPTGAAVRLAQAKVPESLSLAAAILLGIAETVAGVLVLVPRFRKWGAWLGGFLLLAF